MISEAFACEGFDMAMRDTAFQRGLRRSNDAVHIDSAMAPNQALRKADFLLALTALAIVVALIAAPRVLVFGSAGVSLVLACGARFYRATHPSAFLQKLELALWIVVIIAAIYAITILPYNMAVLSAGLVAILSFFSYRAWHAASRSHPVVASFVDLLIWTAGVGALLTVVAISLFLDSL